MMYDYAPEPVPTAATEWWCATFPQHTKRENNKMTVGNILNIEAADPNSPPPDEGEIGFVIQVGPRVYGSAEGFFVTDDDAHSAAVARGFGDFNIKPVLPLWT